MDGINGMGIIRTILIVWIVWMILESLMFSVIIWHKKTTERLAAKDDTSPGFIQIEYIAKLAWRALLIVLAGLLLWATWRFQGVYGFSL